MPNDVIDYNRQRNPDGFGIAWRTKDGRVKQAKFAPNQWGAFRRRLKRVDRNNSVEYVAHWRLATHGPKCKELSHPFTYQDDKEGDVLVFHNGVIDIPIPENESDTSWFVKTVLAELRPRWWANDAYKHVVMQSVGWSRLLVMTANEIVRLSNDWKKLEGIWYSTEPLPLYQLSQKVTAQNSLHMPAMLDDDDDYPDGWESYEDAVSVDRNDPGQGWFQGGHWITPLTVEEDPQGKDGDKSGDATCTQCKTQGIYYIVEGKPYIEIGHRYVSDYVNPNFIS